MRRYLCISVTFLDPLFHGKGDAGDPEWPPSPLRLFQALLAGARTGCRQRDWSDAKADAFRWLEKRDAPWIIAPKTCPALSYATFVPNNDGDKKFERQERLTSKVVFPSRLLGGDPVHYIWPIADAEWLLAESHARVLCAGARHLMALGWGIDVVVGEGRVLDAREVAVLSGLQWKPWRVLRSPDMARRRTPRENTLEDLERVYESFVRSVDGRLYRPPLKPTVFKVVSYLPVTVVPPRPYVTFDLRKDGDRWATFRQVGAVCVAAMLRHRACEAAKRDSHEFPGGSERYVAGHTRDDPTLKNGPTPPRFSYLPLPTVGQKHADGLIRRVLITEPYGGDGSHADWARTRLRSAMLIDQDQRERAIMVEADQADGVLAAYTGTGRSWSTVTPVVLAGYDDGKPAKAEKLILAAVHQAGLSLESVADVTLRKAPFWPGSEHPRFYRRPAYLKGLPSWHVDLRFREEVSGPLAIGAGRHCGLGIFAVCER